MAGTSALPQWKKESVRTVVLRVEETIARASGWKRGASCGRRDVPLYFLFFIFGLLLWPSARLESKPSEREKGGQALWGDTFVDSIGRKDSSERAPPRCAGRAASFASLARVRTRIRGRQCRGVISSDAMPEFSRSDQQFHQLRSSAYG